MSGVSQSEYQSTLDRLIEVDLLNLYKYGSLNEPLGRVALKIASTFGLRAVAVLTFPNTLEDPYDVRENLVFDSDLVKKLDKKLREKKGLLTDAVIDLLNEDKDLIVIMVKGNYEVVLVLGYGRR